MIDVVLCGNELSARNVVGWCECRAELCGRSGEDGMSIELSCVTGVGKDRWCLCVLGCVTRVGEDGVVVLP